MSAAEEQSQPFQKRTSEWSSDCVKQKTSDNVLKRFLKADVKRISSVEEDDDTFAQKYKSIVIDVAKKNIKSDLLKLSALNEINMSLLLRKFNHPEEVKENDSPWSEDSLIAEITNKLSSDLSFTQ